MLLIYKTHALYLQSLPSISNVHTPYLNTARKKPSGP